MARRRRTIIIYAVALIALAAISLPFILRRAEKFFTDGLKLRERMEGSKSSIREVLWERPASVGDQLGRGDLDAYEPRVSPDGDLLVFTRGRPGHDADLWVAARRNGRWTAPRPFEEVNSPEDDLGASFSAGGDLLYLYSNRPGGAGGYDIWVSRRSGEGYGEPRNLGPPVNGPADEVGPAVEPGGGALYFSSDRRPGEEPREPWLGTLRAAGGARYSIYAAKLLEPAGGARPASPVREESDPDIEGLTLVEEPLPRFGEPSPVERLNAPGSSQGAVAFSPAGDFLYFASDRPGGAGGYDLYRARISGGAPGEPASLGPQVNSPGDELDPALAHGGFQLYFSRSSGGREDILFAASREVYLARESGDPYFSLQAVLAFLAGLVGAIHPLILAFLLSLLACLLFVLLLRRRGERLSVLARCFLLALLAHLLLAIWMNQSKVQRMLLDFADQGGGDDLVVSLDSSEADVGGAILGAVAETGGDAPPVLSAPIAATALETAGVAPLASMGIPASEAPSDPGEIPAGPLPTESPPPLPVTGGAPIAAVVIAPLAGEELAPAAPESRAPRSSPSGEEEASAASGAALEGERRPEDAGPQAAPIEVAGEKGAGSASGLRTGVEGAGPSSPAGEHPPAILGGDLAARPALVATLAPMEAADVDPDLGRSTVRAAPRPAMEPEGAESAPALDPGQRAEGPAAEARPLDLSAQSAPATRPSAGLKVEVSGAAPGSPGSEHPDGASIRPAAEPLSAGAAGLPGAGARRDPADPEIALKKTAPPSAGPAAAATPRSPVLGSKGPAGASSLPAPAAAPLGLGGAPVAAIDPSAGSGKDAPAPAPAAPGAVRLPAGSTESPALSAVPSTQLLPDPSPPAITAAKGAARGKGATPAPAPDISLGATGRKAIRDDLPLPPPVELGPSGASSGPPPVARRRPEPSGSAAGGDLAGGIRPIDIARGGERADPGLPAPLVGDSRFLPRIYQLRSSGEREKALRAEGGSDLTEKAVELGLAWLALHQSPDGRWSLRDFASHLDHPSQRDLYHRDWSGRGTYESRGGASGNARNGDTAATGLALLAFLGHGVSHREEGPYRRHVSRGLEWLVRAQDEDGDLRGGGNLYMHGIASFALCEAWAFTRDPRLEEPAQRAIDFTAGCQNPRLGGWRYVPYPESSDVDTSVFGWMLMAMKSARLGGLDLDERCLRLAARYLDSARMTAAGGRYAYQPSSSRTSVAMTAQGFFCQALIEDHFRDSPLWSEEAVRRSREESVRYLLANPPRAADQDGTNFYYWYYATLALFQEGGQAWSAWNAPLKEVLLELQLGPAHGTAAGSWDPIDRRSAAGGRVCSTALSILTLEAYYRYARLREK